MIGGHTVSARLNRIARPAAVLGVAVLLALPAGAAGAAPATAPDGAPAAAPSTVFPRTIPLPDGFRPEGIAIGVLPFAFFGSLADGAIYRANLVTGHGRVISPGPGTPSVGLDLDRRGRLFVAGGNAGDARVVSGFTGDVLASYPLAAGTSFVNDVIVTPDAAWFTDSLNPVLYRVPLGRHGALPAPGQVETVPLTGDFVQQPGFNANGISRSPDRDALLVIQSNTGLLFRVDPDTGVASEVDLGGATLPNGDGILLRGRTLYVVQNQLNQVAVVRLDRSGGSGTVMAELTDPRFDVPTTVAGYGPRLYLPNARFGTDPTPTTPYTAVAIDRH
jgi:sugar lactone lactonase YvrE